MKTLKTITWLFSIIVLIGCSDDVTPVKVWRISSLKKESETIINLKYNKDNSIVSIDQVNDGVSTTFYPTESVNSTVLTYESISGSAERVFTFDADSALLSVYDDKATDFNRKFFYDQFGRMAGYYTSNENGDTSSMREFIWSGNEIPGLKSYGYIDGVRDIEYELVNMTSDEVVNPTYTQLPAELSAVLFSREEFLLYGLANPTKFQMIGENTVYSNLEFDDLGHWTGYTRNQSGAGNEVITIVWQEVTVNR